MILRNATPRLMEAFNKATETKESQEVKFIYNELNNYDTIVAVFEWLYKQSIEFTTKYEEYRFVLIIHPKRTF